MKTDCILFLGKDPSPLELVQAAVSGSGISVLHVSDWFSALQSATTHPPRVLLIGPDIPASDIRLFMERTKSDEALKTIPSVLLVTTAFREIILEFISIGVRSYIIIPCQIVALRNRLAFHIPALSDDPSGQNKSLSNSVGDRLRQRMERKMMQDLNQTLHTAESPPSFPSILLIEQVFSENFGLTVRENERHVSLYEKIDELLLRLGGNNSHLVGLLIQLLSAGKVRIGFREKTERLCLADPKMIMTRDRAVALIDSYLEASSKVAPDPEPNPQTCRLIVR